MKINSVFFDIDGTLISPRTNHLTAGTIDALMGLKRKGIRIFIASGRPSAHFSMYPEELLRIPFDGYILLNGNYCTDQKGMSIFENPIPRKSLVSMIRWIDEHEIVCSFLEADHAYDNRENPVMRKHLRSIGREDRISPVEDPWKRLDHPVYQIWPYFPTERDAEFLRHAPGCKIVRGNPVFADVMPENGGKELGVQAILQYYGLEREECISFGDEGNDAGMLKYTGIGVAMGNAPAHVKEAADIVTDDCEEEGVLKQLVRLGLAEV